MEERHSRIFKNSEVSQQIDDEVLEPQNGYFISVSSKSPTRISFVAHLNKKYTGKGISGM